mgnify:CR=1 FL=1
MGSAVAQVLPLAIGVVASPLPIIAVILILVGPSGRAKAMSFLAGWLAGILVVGLIGVLLVNQASGSSSDTIFACACGDETGQTSGVFFWHASWST